jgi:hypothetical protein
MADYSTNLDSITQGQAQKEVTANADIGALSPSAAFARRDSTSAGLTWGYYGATWDVAGRPTKKNGGTLQLTNNATCYIYASDDGEIHFQTSAPSGWPGPFVSPGSPAETATALYQVTTSGGLVTDWTDLRTARGPTGSPGTNGTNGAGYTATSTTSLVTAGSGSKTFTTQAGLAYTVGARIRATSTGTSEWMEGVITSYSGTSLVATMDKNSGTGTHADWDINLAGQPGTNGTNGTDWSPSTNAQTGATYTLQASDNGVTVTLSNASPITLTVPSGLGANFGCVLIQIGAGQVTVAASGVTLNSYAALVKLAGQHAAATLFAYVANTFNLSGNLSA